MKALLNTATATKIGFSAHYRVIQEDTDRHMEITITDRDGIIIAEAEVSNVGTSDVVFQFTETEQDRDSTIGTACIQGDCNFAYIEETTWAHIALDLATNS